MKHFLVFAMILMSPSAFGSEAFCDTGRAHSIDIQFDRDMDMSGGVTASMRDAQGRAHEGWDRELNREYSELMSLLSAEEKSSLREAQRAWLAFVDAETKFWWSESISDRGTLSPIIVADRGLSLLRDRVCQLARYKRIVSP